MNKKEENCFAHDKSILQAHTRPVAGPRPFSIFNFETAQGHKKNNNPQTRASNRARQPPSIGNMKMYGGKASVLKNVRGKSKAYARRKAFGFFFVNCGFFV